MIYLFNNIEIDFEQFTIRVDGAPVLVEPKVFDLIVYLLNNRQRVVSRDELFEQVWNGREVSDTSLSNHIKTARKVLGDDGNLQHVIKTVRSRGYQFIAYVRIVSASSIEQSVAPSKANIHVNKPVNKTTSRFIPITAVAILLCLLVAMGIWSTKQKEQVQSVPPYLLVVPFSIASLNSAAWQPFADQMTREIIQGLRKVSGIKVVPPPSSFTFKNNKVRAHIKEQLPEVDYVLDGVVSEDIEGNLRITVELENLHQGTLLWDGDFDFQANSTKRFTIQSHISASVSEQLQIFMLEDEKQVLTKIPTTNLVAYNLYVQGQHQLSLMTHQSVLRSITHFSKAIELDPNFEAPYIAKANAYRIIMTVFDKPKDILPKVIASAIDVLEINPESAQIMSLLGIAYVHAWQWEDAWKMLSKAQRKDPNIALTELGFALYFSAMGDVSGVKRSLAKADKLDPLNEEIAEWGLWALMMVNEIDAAITWGEEKLQLHPSLPYPLLSLAVAEYMKGNIDKSIELAIKGVEISQRDPLPLIFLAQSYAAAGKNAQAFALMREAEAKNQYMCPYETAVIYALLDKPDEAFPLLNQAVTYQSNCLIFSRNDPRLKSLSNDTRFTSLLKILALDDESIKNLSVN